MRPLLLGLLLLVAALSVVEAGRRDGRRDTCGSGINRREQLQGIQSRFQAVDIPCPLCEFAVAATREYIDASNATWDDIEKIIQFFCWVLKIEDKNVCYDIVPEFQGVFYWLISDKNISSAFACGVIGICPQQQFPQWNVSLTPTPPAQPYPGPNPKNPSMYVLHVTDIHIDPEYTPGLTSDCGEPICCRPPNPAQAPFAGKWGDYNCDLPKVLYENMLQYIAANLAANLSYAIFTGDMPPHDVWEINRTQALGSADYILDTWKQYLPNLALFPAMGNHEAVPVNEFTPRSVGGYWNMSWLYDNLAERWGYWIPADAQEQTRFGGYYTALSPDGVRIVSLNTNLGCNTEDWFLAFPSPESADPDNQLHWLVSVLDSAEQNNEMVYIIHHINPSPGDCGNYWWNNYLQILDRYKNNIMGEFTGHSHDDEYTVAYVFNNDSSIRPIMHSLFPGSVTPYSDENPGFRVLEIDSVTKAVIDYTEYYINLTHTNLVGYPSWSVLYRARETYDLPDMSPQSWHELSYRMSKNATLLYDYWARRGKDSYASTCDTTCMNEILCATYLPPAFASENICGM